jgi:Matrixin
VFEDTASERHCLSFKNTASCFHRKDVDGEIRKALEVWSAVTQLTFEQKDSGRVHIDIRYHSVNSTVFLFYSAIGSKEYS